MGFSRQSANSFKEQWSDEHERTWKVRMSAMTWLRCGVATAVGGAFLGVCLAGCDGGPPSQTADPAPMSSSAGAATHLADATPIAANLLHVCDRVQDAFRSGGLDDADQNRALSAELQGMIDVADAQAAELLRPMVKAADAIAADGRPRARSALQGAQRLAYDELQRVCVGAGSQAWGE